MTSKERMLRALSRQIPDRLPATVHQWQPYHLQNYLDGVSDLDAFRRFGLDASLARFPLKATPTPDWVTEVRELDAPEGEWRNQFIVRTPGGELEQTIGRNPITQWQITHLIKRPEDLELVDRYHPIPQLDRKALEYDYRQLGEDGIMRGFVMGCLLYTSDAADE